jgi:tetratricopeptide (TPR) repeat protein
MLAPGQSALQLAAHLRAAADDPGFIFSGALGRLTQDWRRNGRLLEFEEAKLILVIDQFEELFTASGISAADRNLFIRLIGNMARSKAVWVIATLRADFWHRAAEVPDLVALAQGAGRLDISTPSSAELAEMIRKPAQAAGLGFETSSESGLGLDAVLAEDAAAEPGVLPLLSFTLDSLYSKDIVKNGRHELTFATYRSLGGLEGAIATRADEVVATLPDAAKTAVPWVLRALATISSDADQTVVARAAPMTDFPEASPARQAVDTMTAARLLVASDENAGATVRLAHEALISHWQRAREQLLTDRRDLQTRALIERQRARWISATSGRQKQQLLLRDPDLANAIDLERRWSDELDPAAREFILKSQQRARLRQQLTAAAAALFALVAVAAIYGLVQAQQERARAEQNYTSAKQAVHNLIADVSDLSTVQGVRVEALTHVLNTVKKTLADLSVANREDPELRSNTALMLISFSSAYLKAGDLDKAQASANDAIALLRALAAENPDNLNVQFFYSESLYLLGSTRRAANDPAGALSAFQQSLDIRQHLAATDPDNRWKAAAAMNLQMVATIRENQGDRADALKSYEDGLALYQKLAAAEPQNDIWRSYEATALLAIGNIRLASGDRAAALAAFNESLDISRKLATAEPANTTWQANLAKVFARIGAVQSSAGNGAEASKAYRASIEISRSLAADLSNRERQKEFGDILVEAGNLLLQGNSVEAIGDFQDALAIRRKIAALEQNDPQSQFLVSLTLNQLASAEAKMGDNAGALAAFQEGLDILDKLLATNPNNGLWQRASGIRLTGIGDVKSSQNDKDGALAAYLNAADHFRKATAIAPNNLEWQLELATDLQKIAALSDTTSARAALQEELTVIEPLARDNKLPPALQSLVKSIQDKLAVLQ